MTGTMRTICRAVAMLVLMGPVIASAAKQSRVFPQAAVWIASLRSQ
ncbi:hypothetical protein AB7M16_005235 [Bradyrhizobium sp. USDA 372]